MPVPSVSLGTGTSTRSADGRAWATSDAPQDAGLAGSVRSDQSDRLAFGHGEVNFVENAVAVNLPRDAGDDELIRGSRASHQDHEGGHADERSHDTDGISRGANGVRASASTQIRKIAPRACAPYSA